VLIINTPTSGTLRVFCANADAVTQRHSDSMAAICLIR
jgi:hypothetical protein